MYTVNIRTSIMMLRQFIDGPVCGCVRVGACTCVGAENCV